MKKNPRRGFLGFFFHKIGFFKICNNPRFIKEKEDYEVKKEWK
jgi:hypothetical protein